MFIDCEHELVFRSSRERKVIALCFGEAEFCSLPSGLCHALLFKGVMQFFSHQVARRCGARRIKHPGARVLWVHIDSIVVELNLVNTNENKEILGRTTMQRPRLMKLLEFARTQTSEVPEDDQNSMQSIFLACAQTRGEAVLTSVTGIQESRNCSQCSQQLIMSRRANRLTSQFQDFQQ